MFTENTFIRDYLRSALARLDDKKPFDNHPRRAQTPANLEKQPWESISAKGNAFPLELNNSLKQVVKVGLQNSDTRLLKLVI